jgi:hypothetical protein
MARSRVATHPSRCPRISRLLKNWPGRPGGLFPRTIRSRLARMKHILALARPFVHENILANPQPPVFQQPVRNLHPLAWVC